MPATAAPDERLEGAAARPAAVVPETIIVDPAKAHVSAAFTTACKTLDISVQPTPHYAPATKGLVKRTLGTTNALLYHHPPNSTGSDVTRPRAGGRNQGLLLSVAQLQDLLDEWLVHCHHRHHEDPRHPTLPRKALTPNQMWAALITVTGHLRAVP